jgi:hypothetical protein
MDISQGIGRKTILSESHGVLDFLMALKEKALIPDLEYSTYLVLFKYNRYSPINNKILFKKQTCRRS